MKLKNLVNKFAGDTNDTIFYVIDHDQPKPYEMDDEMLESLDAIRGIEELCEVAVDDCSDVKDIYFEGNNIYIYVDKNEYSTDLSLSEFIASVTDLKDFEPFFITFQNEDSTKITSLTVDDEDSLDFLREFAEDTELHVTAISASGGRVLSISVVDDATFNMVAECFKIKFCKKTKIN